MSNPFDEGIMVENGKELSIHCFLNKCSIRSTPPSQHYHTYIEILYGTEDSAFAFIGNQKYLLEKGDLIIVNAKEPHTFLAQQEGACYICVKFSPDILYVSEKSAFEFKYILPFILNTSPDFRYFKKDILKNSPVDSIMKNMLKEYTEKEYGYELSLRADILNIFLWILRYWKNHNISFSENTGLTSETIEQIQKSVKYIQQNYTEITAEKAAKKAGMSYYYFCRSFKKLMNMNFNKYVNSLKIQEAERLLVSTDMTITEVALQSGFSDTSYFIQKFKEYNGISPNKYRKTVK